MSKNVNFSEYQLNIFNEVENNDKNIVINAVAGSGKTFTIVECCKRLHAKGVSRSDILFLAFNNSIVSELEEKIGSYAEVHTCHRFGNKAISRALGKNGIIKSDKYREILKRQYPDLTPSAMGQVLDLLDKCRLELIQSGQFDLIDGVADHHGIIVESQLVVEIVSELLKGAYRLPYNRVIDFTDMLALSVTACKQYVPTYRYVFVDECQDLDTSKRELLLLASKGGRFIAVGDPFQAINGFAGADCDSFAKLTALDNVVTLPLSVNYRCGRNIIEMAQQLVPTITAHDGAIEGDVIHTTDFTTDLFAPNTMVLCRKNAPLVSTALKCIAKGITALVKGKDIGKGLVNLIKRVGGKTTTDAWELESKLDRHLYRETTKVARKKHITNDEASEDPSIVGLKDKIACIQAVIAYKCPQSVEELIEGIEELFSDYRRNDAVTFSTIHKAKGLESDKVVIIAPDKLPLMWKGQLEWQFQQELNLKYVAVTRAKKELYILDIAEKELLATNLK